MKDSVRFGKFPRCVTDARPYNEGRICSSIEVACSVRVPTLFWPYGFRDYHSIVPVSGAVSGRYLSIFDILRTPLYGPSFSALSSLSSSSLLLVATMTLLEHPLEAKLTASFSAETQALTLFQAYVLATIFETLGAILVGSCLDRRRKQ